MQLNKFFKGSILDFTEWLALLKIEAEEDEKKEKQYIEITKSVVYISDNFDTDPEEYIDMDSFDGAIYAHGAIISGGGSAKWADTSTDISPEPEQ